MKTSFYNNYINLENSQLIYNSYSNNFILLNKNLLEILENNITEPDRIKSLNNKLYDTLIENGFIVSKNINEKELFASNLIKRRFSNRHFDLMINPTMDCNLKCWYCYETHQKNSCMSQDVILRIEKHLKLKLDYEPFNTLNLSFFGGEPLLKTKQVVIPLINMVKKLSETYGFSFMVSFTTNGTLMSSELLSILYEIPANFQITIDGNKESHNKTRCFKNGNNSYDRIMKNIEKINKQLKNFHINLRINYDENSLSTANEIVDSLDFISPKRMKYNLIKIWQVDSKSISKKTVQKTINYIKEKGYSLESLIINRRDHVCYADNFNQLLVNFNGEIFKCTARDFNDKNSLGVLLDNGEIQWKNEPLKKRLFIENPVFCKECSFLPACPGICSQKLLEQKQKKSKAKCVFESMKISKEEFIINSFECSYIENNQ